MSFSKDSRRLLPLRGRGAFEDDLDTGGVKSEEDIDELLESGWYPAPTCVAAAEITGVELLVGTLDGALAYPWRILPCFHFTPQALQRVPAPSGPLLHIGVLLHPQYAHFFILPTVVAFVDSATVPGLFPTLALGVLGPAAFLGVATTACQPTMLMTTGIKVTFLGSRFLNLCRTPYLLKETNEMEGSFVLDSNSYSIILSFRGC
jgi:hypothetical protein